MEKLAQTRRKVSPSLAVQCPSCFTLNLPDYQPKTESDAPELTCVLCGRKYEPGPASLLPAA